MCDDIPQSVLCVSVRKWNEHVRVVVGSLRVCRLRSGCCFIMSVALQFFFRNILHNVKTNGWVFCCEGTNGHVRHDSLTISCSPIVVIGNAAQNFEIENENCVCYKHSNTWTAANFPLSSIRAHQRSSEFQSTIVLLVFSMVPFCNNM